MRRLAKKAFLSRLETLDLYNNPISEEAAAIWFASPHLSNLRTLFLGEGDTTPGMIDVLAASRLSALKELYLWDFHSGDLGDDGLARLASAESFAGLTVLDLLHTGAGSRGAESIAGSKHLTQLKRLSFGQMACGYSNNRIGARGVAALAVSTNLFQVESLGLALNQIGDAGLSALADSPYVQRLTTLGVEANEIGNAGVIHLARSTRLPALSLLNLSHNAVGDQGAVALACSPYLDGLECLWLLNNQVGPAGVQALARSPCLRGLRRLSLSRNPIGDEGVQALLRSDLVEKLDLLHLQFTPLSDSQKEALKQKFGARVSL
jgi:hypothetical protein